MRWIVFAVLLYAAVVLQTALMPFAELHGVRPDLPALLATFVALTAPGADALLAAFVTGIVVDLCDSSFAGGRANVGVNALAYTLVMGLLVRLRRLMFREHASTFFIVSGLSTASIHALAAVHAAWATDTLRELPSGLLWPCFAALYTALVSPYAFWLLRRTRPVLGVGPIRTLRAKRS